MTKQLAIGVILSLLWLATLGCSPAMALTSTPPDGTYAQTVSTFALERLGSLYLPNGRLNMVDGNVEIEAIPESLFDPRAVLLGKVIATVPIAGQNGKSRLLIYVYAGPWLEYLGPKPASEIISLKDGRQVSGHIVEGDADTLSVRIADDAFLNVPLQQITGIASSRAFWLDAPSAGTLHQQMIGLVPRARMAPTVVVARQSMFRRPVIQPLGNERGMSKLAFGSYLAADIAMFVAPIVAAPIVFTRSLAGQQALINQANRASAASVLPAAPLIPGFGGSL